MNLLDKPWGRRLTFAALYASEGAPIGYIWWALPTKLKSAGVPIDAVTALTAMVTLPWALKFLWAPLVDTLRSSRWGLRGWLVSSQIAMGVALIPIILSTPFDVGDLSTLTVLLLIHAFTAATQDVSIDAMAIASVPESERGATNGWMQLGMLGARAAFGGAALYVERFIGERAVLMALLACIWLSTLLVIFAVQDPSPEGSGSRSFLPALKRAMSARSTWFGFGFALFAGAGFKAVGAVAGPMMLEGGLSKQGVGLFFTATAGALALGALVGGRLSDRLGRATSVSALVLLLAVGVITTALSVASGVSALVIASLGLLYLLAGAFTAAELALFMDATDVRLGATQFSAFMGVINLCEVWSSFSVGRLVVWIGYPWAIVCLAAASLLALPLVHYVLSPRAVAVQPA